MIGPEQIYLTHMSHWFPPHEKSKQLLPDNVHMAWDGLELVI
jgi:phosphoribosyl 1,2-cyclic phosphodiesterase